MREDWIPAFAGMTNLPFFGGMIGLRDINPRCNHSFIVPVPVAGDRDTRGSSTGLNETDSVRVHRNADDIGSLVDRANVVGGGVLVGRSDPPLPGPTGRQAEVRMLVLSVMSVMVPSTVSHKFVSSL